MLVETFECAETKEETPIESQEALDLIESLGLEGQKKLISPNEEKIRCPYREIRKDESFTYQILCPKEDKLSNYSAGPIPLRVLQIAAHAQSLDLFKELWVWSQEGADKDPVLIASTERHSYSKGTVYILARWGDELETFSVLMKRAVDFCRKNLIEKAESMLANIRSCPESEIIEKGVGRNFYL